MYKSIPVGVDTYLLECARYIERNPVRAGLVKVPQDYPYSSFLFYAKGKKDKLLAHSPAYLQLSTEPQERQRLYVEYVNAIRPQEEFAVQGKIHF